MSALVLALAGFVGMEAVSYALHRWVMHGVGMTWHRSHHQPPAGRFERNDRFPLVFGVIGVALFALGAGPWPPLWWLAVGVTAYGLAYLLVHEVFIHRRLPLPMPSWRYLVWLRDAHRDHHVAGGEPFGMLLPLVRDRSTRTLTRDPLARGPQAWTSRGATQDAQHPGAVVALDDDERRVDADRVRQHHG